ncbi:MAG TPA: hypothetical protein VHY35_15715 [Stellaceae bacterium]|jgi:hypothetical protein|nr:hypothetical protein [Stellaceae bacterium]
MTKLVNIGPPAGMVRGICQTAGAWNLIDDTRVSLARRGVIEAVRRHNTAAIFDWLLNALSFQGISDSIAAGYMNKHGRVRWNDIAVALAATPNCPKLRCYWSFSECNNRKTAAICANPSLRPTCPLPQHNLRNGRLNQTAYSLFFFIRDIAGGDFVGWLDRQLAAVAAGPTSDRPARLRQALLEPLGHVHGVSNKVLAMALSDLLIAADAKRPAWIEAGSVMIAIDTLVHNFLHRTGILGDIGAEHAYGPRCYAENGCAAIIERIAGKIDARHYNPAFPANFPRFVQHAIWRFCAEAGLNRCNGRRIDDRAPCAQSDCPMFTNCARVPLKPT